MSNPKWLDDESLVPEREGWYWVRISRPQYSENWVGGTEPEPSWEIAYWRDEEFWETTDCDHDHYPEIVELGEYITR